MDAGGVRCGPQCPDELGVLGGRPEPAALTVHGVLDVQADRPGAEQTVDEARRRLPVAGLDVDGHRDIDRIGDLDDAGEQFVERHALVVGPADRVGDRMAADRQRREAGVDGQLRRPRVPHRRQHHRVAGLVQFQQRGRTLLKNLVIRHIPILVRGDRSHVRSP